jgi:hypothetical protein
MPRALVITAAVVAAAGCSAAVAETHLARKPRPTHARGHAAGTPEAVATTASAASAHTAAARARAVVRPPAGYRVAASESYPATKQAAVRVALDLTTYSPGTTLSEIARRVTSDPAQQRTLEQSAAPLFHAGGASTGTIVYPQMGGMTTDQASVMAVVRQSVRTAGGTDLVQTRTLDIRLSRAGSHWRFAELASAGGEPVARPATLSPGARAVLDNPRIFLPDSARWDIYRGAVSTTLLQLMARIAERAPYAVTVLETGHPYDVFGTSHMSMHSAGRAVDINLFAGRHVVDQRGAGSPAYDLVTWLMSRLEVGQVGSPWDMDGSAGRSFTNGVHLDHIHISV